MSRRIITPGRSCLECRRRKIKCDRSFPCGYCVRIRNRCEYPPQSTSRVISELPQNVALSARVDQLENTLNSLHHLDKSTKNAHAPQPATPPPPTRITDPARDGLHKDCSDFSTSNVPSWTLTTFPFGINSTPPPDCAHPPIAIISSLWQAYIDAVDPFLKILHVPTIQKRVMRFIRCPSSIENSMECLLFAIYYCAVVAMPAAMCRSDLQEGKLALVRRYRAAAEHALLRANFLRSQDMIVLQALVLYIESGRHDRNGPDVSMLIGLAVGHAMRMGLHCEKDTVGLSPFEIEMRRRLWWQIYSSDVRIAADQNIQPTIFVPTFSTEMPSNVNDANLDPNMQELPQAQQGKTEIIFTLIQFHISKLARQILCSSHICHRDSLPLLITEDKLQMVQRFNDDIEERYLAYCDVAIPFDFVTTATTRIAVLKLKLALYRPLADPSQGMQATSGYRTLCYDILRQSHALRQCGRESRWFWLIEKNVEWDIFAYSLLDACTTPNRNTAGGEWEVVERIYKDWKSDNQIRQDRRWSSIEYLHSQALVAPEIIQAIPNTPRLTSLDDEELTAANRQNRPERLPTTPRRVTRKDACQPPGSVTSTMGPASTKLNTGLSDEEDMSDQGSLGDPICVEPSAGLPVSKEARLEAPELPTSGTACEWSTGLLEQYLEVITLGPLSAL